jgi:predicted DNA-binding transcriptional regulator AlpA
MEKRPTPDEMNATLRGDRYLTLTELRTKIGGRSRSAIYLDLAAGRLPQPIKLGGRLYWPEGDLDAHLRNMREQVA